MLAQLKLACLSGLSLAQVAIGLGVLIGVMTGRLLPARSGSSKD